MTVGTSSPKRMWWPVPRSGADRDGRTDGIRRRGGSGGLGVVPFDPPPKRPERLGLRPGEGGLVDVGHVLPDRNVAGVLHPLLVGPAVADRLVEQGPVAP